MDEQFLSVVEIYPDRAPSIATWECRTVEYEVSGGISYLLTLNSMPSLDFTDFDATFVSKTNGTLTVPNFEHGDMVIGANSDNVVKFISMGLAPEEIVLFELTVDEIQADLLVAAQTLAHLHA